MGGATGWSSPTVRLHRTAVRFASDSLSALRRTPHPSASALRDYGFIASISGRGNCYENAIVETVFKTIKSELIWRTAFTSRDQASKAIGQYIEGFYNPRRRHSSLGYVSPAAFEAAHRTRNRKEQLALH